MPSCVPSGRESERYNLPVHGYAIDYGAYVHLNNTANAVQGTLIGDNDEYIEIPMIDYRSVRRAILDVEAFQYTLVSANTSN